MHTALKVLASVPLLLPIGIPTRATTIPVDSASDGTAVDGLCGLREAINNANLPFGGDTTGGDCVAGSLGSDTIELPAGTYTISLPGNTEDQNLSGDLDIRDDLNIFGAGAAVTVLDGAR